MVGTVVVVIVIVDVVVIVVVVVVVLGGAVVAVFKTFWAASNGTAWNLAFFFFPFCTEIDPH